MLFSLVLAGDWQGQAQMAQISLLAAYRAGRDLVPHPRYRLSKAKNRGVGTDVAIAFTQEPTAKLRSTSHGP